DLERLLPEYHRYRAVAARSVETACQHNKLYREFFKQRGVDDRHIHAPQTFYTKKMVRFAAKGEPDKRKFFWMWNPQNYGDYFKSTIIYESYPTSQDEVDDILAHLRLRTRVFYDPYRPAGSGGKPNASAGLSTKISLRVFSSGTQSSIWSSSATSFGIGLKYCGC